MAAIRSLLVRSYVPLPEEMLGHCQDLDIYCKGELVPVAIHSVWRYFVPLPDEMLDHCQDLDIYCQGELVPVAIHCLNVLCPIAKWDAGPLPRPGHLLQRWASASGNTQCLTVRYYVPLPDEMLGHCQDLDIYCQGELVAIHSVWRYYVPLPDEMLDHCQDLDIYCQGELQWQHVHC